MSQTLPNDVISTLKALKNNVDGRNAYVAALRDAGWSLAVIAKALGVSKPTVARYAAKAKSDTPVIVSPPEAPIPGISERYNGCVRRSLSHGDIVLLQNLYSQRHSQELNKTLYELSQEGVVQRELASALGITKTSVRERIRRHERSL